MPVVSQGLSVTAVLDPTDPTTFTAKSGPDTVRYRSHPSVGVALGIAHKLVLAVQGTRAHVPAPHRPAFTSSATQQCTLAGRCRIASVRSVVGLSSSVGRLTDLTTA